MKFSWFLLFALLLPMGATAADVPAYSLALKNHRYVPDVLHVPANTRLRIDVANNDPMPEEFESNDFPVEKIVMPMSRISVFVGPLKPGRYAFFGDFHQATAKGTLIVE